MSGEMETLLHLGPFTVTPYSLMMALAALAGIIATGLAGKKRLADRAWTLAVLSVPAAIFGGHFAWCCAFFPALESDYGGYTYFLKFNEGGYTLFGAVFFVLFLAALLAKRWKVSAGLLLDVLAPGSALAICIGRIAEYFNGQGVGQFVEEDGLRMFPFAVCTYDDGEWSEWYVAVFVFEAFAALIMFAVAVYQLKRDHRDGYPGAFFLMLLSSTQIFLEQLRADDLVRFGFVRFSQLCGLLILLVMLYMKLKRKGWGPDTAISLTRFLSAVACVTFIEFAFEKPQFYPWLMASIFVLGASVLVSAIRAEKRGDGKTLVRFSLCAVFLLLCAGMIFVLTQGYENEWTYLFAFMALSCLVMGFEAAPAAKKEAEPCIM